MRVDLPAPSVFDQGRKAPGAHRERNVIEREHRFAGFALEGVSNAIQLQRVSGGRVRHRRASVAVTGACCSVSQPPPNAL